MRSPSSSASTAKIRGMRPRPERLESLPDQYFAGLLARVAAAQARDGEPVVDLGRGNPDIGPPAHVVERLYEVALQPTALVHGYAPFLGLLELKEAIAARYRDLYGVELDPATEVAVSPARRRRSSSSRSARSSGARRSCFPIPGTRTTPRHPRSRARARFVCRSTRPRAGLPISSGRHGRTWRALPQLPVQPVRRLRARRQRSRRRSTSPSKPAPQSCTTSPTGISCTTGGRRGAS